MTAPQPQTGRAPGRLGIGIIGTGRVGAVLGSALRAAGHAIVGVSAVSEESRDRAAIMLPDVPILPIPDIVERAELVVIATPDDAIKPLVDGLATTGAWQTGQIVLHVSGAHGLDVLDAARGEGALVLAVHPVMTFTGTSLDIARLEGAPFAVTAPSAFLPIAQALVVEMGGEPVVIAEEQRATYHAALAHASNHLVTLLAQADELLKAAGVEAPGTLIRHLVDASADGALRRSADGADPIGALTGPVSRGDVGTVASHLAEVGRVSARDGQSDLIDSYRVLAQATADRAYRARRITEVQYGQLRAFLTAPSNTSKNREEDDQ